MRILPPKNSWEMMGRPHLVFSPIQFPLANQYRIYPIGCLDINLGNVQTVADFKVIEIVYEKETDPTLLGFEWASNNEAIINLKKGEISFKIEGLKVLSSNLSIQQKEGSHYVEPMEDGRDN